ncbi:putative S-adenosylmethionine-dependent methyltransferase of the seven beta-strand family [Xylariaceae sp. FL0804]|nr:putative S-adenosylmethionine-dependent methyltransferase of the seven beta-strand family [Xylariaceae sp. FL0804]
MSRPANLEPSKLGTKEYWDALYARELRNHADDPADTGTVWFDDSDAEARMVEFLLRHSDGADADADGDDDDDDVWGDLSRARSSFLDLGTGNGALLFALRDAGWRGPMLGVDYSGDSVELARRVARGRARRRARRERRRRLRGAAGGGEEEDNDDEDDDDVDEEDDELSLGRGEEAGGDSREEGEETPDVEFAEHDILNGSPASLLSFLPSSSSSPLPETAATATATAAAAPPPGGPPGGFDVVLDKGTFDAVSLSSASSSASSSSSAAAAYRGRVLPLVRDAGGLFLVTSCNWTEAELRAWFVENDDGEDGDDGDDSWGFEVAGRVEYPSFRFGGVEGQTISTLCFRKVRRRRQRQG